MIIRETGMRYSDYVIALRRKFHRCPEPSLEEYRTCKMICEELRTMGLEPRVVHNTGVVADIKGGEPGGSTDNAIPDVVTIGGTTRSFNQALRDSYPDTMNRVIRHVAAAFRAEAELDYRRGAPPVINDHTAAEWAKKAVAANFGEESVAEFQPIMGGEDFSEYQAIVPGVFVFLGVGNEELGATWPQHSNHYRIDESVLIKGAVAAAQYAVDFLKRE